MPLLAMTLLIAAPLRLVWLDSYPPGLFYDPAGEGIDAQRILEGARPIFLPANNGREPLLNYLMAGVFAVTGPTIGGLRLTVALIGLTSVPVTFLWARAFFGPRVALLTAALMAVSTWHLFLSRFGVRAVLLPLLEPLALLLVWRATQSGRPLTWAAAGATLGLSAYTYLPIRVFPVVVLVLLVVGFVRRRRVALTALLIIAPLALYFLQHPGDANERVSQVSLLATKNPLRQIAESLLRTLGMFVWLGDQWIYTNVPYRPVFDLLIAPFFLLGLAVVVQRARRPAYAMLLVWLATMMLPGVLATGAPNFQRTAGLMPAVFVLPALGLACTTAWLARRFRPRAVTWAVPSAVILLSGVLTVWAYFVELPRDPDLWKWYETDVAALGSWARSLSAEEQVYALLPSLPDVGRAENQHTTLTFLSGRRVWAFEPDTFPVADTSQRPATYLFPSPTEADARVALPRGHEERFADPFSGRPLFAHRIEAGAPFEPRMSSDLHWPNGAHLLGWTLVQERPAPTELILFWAPDGPSVGRMSVSMLDGDGRDRDVARVQLRSLICPPELCGRVRAVARRVYLSPPDKAQPPFTLRLRVLDDHGDPLEARDGAGKGVGQIVRLARFGG